MLLLKKGGWKAQNKSLELRTAKIIHLQQYYAESRLAIYPTPSVQRNRYTFVQEVAFASSSPFFVR